MVNYVLMEFVRLAIGQQAATSIQIENIDWDELYEFAKKQAIVGVLFSAIEKLPEAQQPPKKTKLKWYMHAERIKQKNEKVNEVAVKLSMQYIDAGFQCCILKGQGNTLMYPNPLRRTPGDIDIWMKPKGMSMVKDMDSIRENITTYIRNNYRIGDTRYYHIEFKAGDIPIEAHFMPGIMNNPIYNKRLQRFYAEQQDRQCDHWVELPEGAGRIPVPTSDFNVIFQLGHMMHHFFDEGIGLRQMMDYYYLIQDRDVQNRKEEIAKHFGYLGLRKFAGAVMFIMKEVLGIEDNYLLVPVDQKRGRTLLSEIFKGGNFGQHSGLTQHGTASKYLLKNWRNFQLVTEYPAEALAEPLFRTYHFIWRRFNG